MYLWKQGFAYLLKNINLIDIHKLTFILEFT